MGTSNFCEAKTFKVNEYGSTGKRTFLLSSFGDIFSCRNLETRYSGETRPKFDAGFSVPDPKSFWKQHLEGGKAPAANNRGEDGQDWIVVG